MVSKDLSNLRVENFRSSNVDTCVAAYQKKQEFGPGNVVINNLVNGCKGSIYAEANSSVIIH